MKNKPKPKPKPQDEMESARAYRAIVSENPDDKLNAFMTIFHPNIKPPPGGFKTEKDPIPCKKKKQKPKPKAQKKQQSKSHSNC